MTQSNPKSEIRNSKSPPTLAILGCGWLGLPLARRMITKGWRVNGSTTTPDKMKALREAGIKPFVIQMNDADVAGAFVPEFLNADQLVVCVPPGGRRDPRVELSYPRRMAALARRIARSPVSRVIFTSSTSVYPEINRAVVEDDAGNPPTASGRACLAAERVLGESPGFTTAIVRLGGLIGADRHPGRFLAGRTNIEGGNAPVNLIHQDDAVGAIIALLERPGLTGAFNACAPTHPTRREFYTREAARLGLPAPEFSRVQAPWKIVSSVRLQADLQYDFRHPDLMALDGA